MQLAPKYELAIKQTVDYPRCRIYRGLIRDLIGDRNIRTNGDSGLFHYTVLCSYVNFRTSYRNLDGITYTVFPGEWACRVTELRDSLRLRMKYQVFDVLDRLQQRGLLRYSLLGHGSVVKYSIRHWSRFNTVLDYNCPCQKDTGFFFLPYSTVSELVSYGKCSEMDMILDLWVSAIYCDDRVQGSRLGPVAYFRNGTGNPLASYSELGMRWGISKATVGRALKKLSDHGYISMMTFPGRHGTAIYLQNYLSTMFQIADVPVDKAEVALCLDIEVSAPISDDTEVSTPESTMPAESGCVANEEGIVSKSEMEFIAGEARKALAALGFSCLGCPRAGYKLYLLSDCREGKRGVGGPPREPLRYRMDVTCANGKPVYSFELTLRETADRKGVVCLGK